MQPIASSAWRHAILLLVPLISWIFAWYWGTAVSMVEIWMRSGTYAHALVVPPIAFWLIWRRRENLRVLVPSTSFPILIPLAATVFLWLLGELTAVNALRQFAFVGILVLVIVALLGTTVCSRILFPLAFIFFSVPFGDFIVPKLMDWTAEFTVAALRATGVPVYQEGLQFVIPSGNWSVVEACSGIRYIIASLTVGTLFAYLNYASLKRRLIFIGISLVVPLVANWLRAYMIVMLGHLSNNKLAAGVDHLIYGWVFFGIVIILMFMVGARWSEHERIASIPAAPPKDPVHLGNRWAVAVAVGFISAAGPLAFWSIDAADEGKKPVLASLNVPAGWEASSAELDFEPAYGAPSDASKATFSKDGKVVGVRIYYYRNQDERRKMVTSTNALVSSSDSSWKHAGQSLRPVKIDGLPNQVMSYRLIGSQTPPGTNITAWRWYWIQGKLTASDPLAKLYTAISRLRGQGDDSAVVILYSADDETDSSALPDFAQASGMSIMQLLMSTASER